MDLHIDSRDIRVTVQDIISVQDDTNTQVIEFVFTKELLEYALWELNAFVIYAVSGSTGVRFDICTKTVTDTELKVQWVIRKPVTYAEGKLQFQVVFTDTPDPITKVSEHRWSTKIAVVTIPKTLAREKYVIDTEPVIEQMMAIAAQCVEAGDKVSRAEAAAVRAEQAADSIQEAVDANNAAQAAKTETISAKNATIAAAQTAQLEAEKVQKIVAGNEAYTKQESDLKYTVAPRKEASSANGELKLTDADDGLSYLELQGNSEQYTNTANKNLIDLHFATDGYYVNNVNGNLSVNPNYKASTYIEVIPGESYFLSNGSSASPGAMYNANKAYVQGVTTGLNVIPDGVKYVRISANKAIQTAASTQFEKGTQGTEIVIGAVDTPSPDYPSEVKSVGDIPKDVNGVEIRNILDIDGILARPDSDWTVPASGRTFSIPLDVSKQKIGGRLFEAISHPRFNLGLSNSTTSLGDGTSGFYLAAPSIPYKGFDFSSSAAVNLFIYVTGTDPIDLAMVKEILDKERNKFLFTYASEVDEYRPYIGENNGLVKVEAAGKNMFMVSNVKPQGQATPTEIMGDTIKVSGAWYADCKIFNLKKNTNYTLSGTVLSANAVIRISLYDYTTSTMINDAVSKYGSITSADFKEYSATFNTENLDLSHDYRVMLYCGNGTTNQGTTVYKNIQLEEGTIKTEYQPYHQQITWIPLREPLRSVSVSGGYTDTVDKNGNITVRVAKRHCKDLFIGGVRVSYGYNNDTYFTAVYNNPTQNYDKSTGIGTYPNRDFTINKMLSQMFKWGNAYGGKEVMIIAGLGASPHYISTILRYDRLGLTSSATDEELKAKLIEWLASNDPIVYLGIEEGSQFIDLYKYQIPAVYIETYDQETNVRCLNKVKPSSMGLDYKIAMSSLIKRLEALEEKTVQEV